MQQIKLDDKHDLAIDGNEAWIIDYSAGLFSPRAGEKHTFHLSLVRVIKRETWKHI